MTSPELSIIVPILNEREQLPELLADLARQHEVDFELIMVDGGSEDGSSEWLQARFAESVLPGKLISSARGRGRQLNRGSREAVGDWLLFLHADSRFEDPRSLRIGLDHLRQTGSRKIAGHFTLSFRRTGQEPSAGYYFYEWKARLGRPETIHGDQGFLLSRDFFTRIGPFREDLPVMEDTDFAERLRFYGNWILLPAQISTSARRFDEEGLWQRQLLNAILMCLRTVGYERFFQAAPDIYRQQPSGRPLMVRPFFGLVRKLFAEHNLRQRGLLWWRCGSYVRNHAWQLTFALDAKRAFRTGLPIAEAPMPLTERFEPVYDLLTDNPLGRLLASLLLRLWFEATDFWLRWQEKV